MAIQVDQLRYDTKRVVFCKYGYVPLTPKRAAFTTDYHDTIWKIRNENYTDIFTTCMDIYFVGPDLYMLGYDVYITEHNGYKTHIPKWRYYLDRFVYKFKTNYLDKKISKRAVWLTEEHMTQNEEGFNEKYKVYFCSCCGEVPAYGKRTPYCANCGSIMKGLT